MSALVQKQTSTARNPDVYCVPIVLQNYFEGVARAILIQD